MNYHVFIVDVNTFTYHLEHMFAGTGAGEDTALFLSNPTYMNPRRKEDGLTASTEKKLVGMIADISRIRIGDKIIFYLQAGKDNPGMFFGVFKASSTAFFDENDEENYLKNLTNKPLTFRILIEPDIVFPYGVSEHMYLDSLENITHPSQMCWSLIYRKLKGNRGCTMITENEYNLLLNKLYLENPQGPYSQTLNNFKFNHNAVGIEPSQTNNIYNGRQADITIDNRMIVKHNRSVAFETHLQAHIMKNFDSVPFKDLLLMYPDSPCWIGNEVSCGVGMQRIDTMTIQENDNHVFIKIIELKDEPPTDAIVKQQLPWYVYWTNDYIAHNYLEQGKIVHIIPCIIAQSTTDPRFYSSVNNFNENRNLFPNVIVEPVEYISFNISDEGITFSRQI